MPAVNACPPLPGLNPAIDPQIAEDPASGTWNQGVDFLQESVFSAF
jgi:hypothetical protein